MVGTSGENLFDIAAGKRGLEFRTLLSRSNLNYGYSISSSALSMSDNSACILGAKMALCRPPNDVARREGLKDVIQDASAEQEIRRGYHSKK